MTLALHPQCIIITAAESRHQPRARLDSSFNDCCRAGIWRLCRHTSRLGQSCACEQSLRTNIRARCRLARIAEMDCLLPHESCSWRLPLQRLQGAPARAGCAGITGRGCTTSSSTTSPSCILASRTAQRMAAAGTHMHVSALQPHPFAMFATACGRLCAHALRSKADQS